MEAVPDPFSKVVELVPDELDCNLSTKPPHKIIEGSDRALFGEHGRATLESRVVHLQRGVFDGRTAVLLAFEFQFIGSVLSSSKRIVSADVDMSFDVEAITSSSPAHPSVQVQNYSPALVEGIPTERTRERDRVIRPNLGINSPPVIIQGGLEVTVGERVTFQDVQRLRLEGSASGSDTRSEIHRARWQVKENKATRAGIPSPIRVAALIKMKENVPLLCTLRLEALCGRRRLLGLPWTLEAPLVMEADATVGKVVDVVAFEHMTEQDWESLLHISYPVSVSQHDCDNIATALRLHCTSLSKYIKTQNPGR
ncbi:hypothetical protein DL765_010640 [Monosporascus sp. GIB2]|nr:hypothetical protein DL765_010640 [Monosporascus sp. GIB2]